MPEIRYCAEAYTPMTVKTQNFIILLPLRQYSKMELSTILLHEMIHIKHNDLKKLHVGRILTIIFWFYPIAYLFYHNIELICETACVCERISEKYSVWDNCGFKYSSTF